MTKSPRCDRINLPLKPVQQVVVKDPSYCNFNKLIVAHCQVADHRSGGCLDMHILCILFKATVFKLSVLFELFCGDLCLIANTIDS